MKTTWQHPSLQTRCSQNRGWRDHHGSHEGGDQQLRVWSVDFNEEGCLNPDQHGQLVVNWWQLTSAAFRRKLLRIASVRRYGFFFISLIRSSRVPCAISSRFRTCLCLPRNSLTTASWVCFTVCFFCFVTFAFCSNASSNLAVFSKSVSACWTKNRINVYCETIS
jgi:hypothetical protein